MGIDGYLMVSIEIQESASWLPTSKTSAYILGTIPGTGEEFCLSVLAQEVELINQLVCISNFSRLPTELREAETEDQGTAIGKTTIIRL